MRPHVLLWRSMSKHTITTDVIKSQIFKYETDKSIMKPPKAIQKGKGFVMPAWDKTEFIGNISNKYVISEVFVKSKKFVQYDLFDIQTGKLVASCNYSTDESFDILAVENELIYAKTERSEFPEVLVLEFSY